ncbi:enoyl-CoA hydratase-related protein [Chelativorans sp. AA-79]|uniref:enoyl-CoA hydratase/isomerase family protein n=1 Tax=Chelativorans sp. AA-79 TaxID=3028735 RepID=UPI0023F6249F|nr:enoyl-CoA hydratase-related protein [Chelativorans sp. AA-79]WEX12456.1 enoyl-CoA hydratase-related protein [Chelativorans sp. AA-79]
MTVELLEEHRDGVVTLALNRPEKRNALSIDLLSSIHEAVRRLSSDETVRVLVFSGGLDVFAAGGDITQLQGATPEEMFRRYEWQRYLWDSIESFPRPTIAMIAGLALGGGCELALCCDFRIVSPDAVIGLPETRIGVMPGAGGTQRLARLIGTSRAKEIIFLGETVPAEQALAYGLVNKVVEKTQLVAETQAFADRLARAASFPLQMAKVAINAGQDVPLPTALKIERLAFSNLFGSADHVEGVGAFLEKRKPDFKRSKQGG